MYKKTMLRRPLNLDAISLLLVVIACATLPLRILGANFSDLSRVWFASSDLVGSYEKALSFITNGNMFFSDALGFPNVQENLWSRVNAFDGAQVLIHYGLVSLTRNPILGTNLFLISQFVLTGILSYLLLRSLHAGHVLSAAFAISIALMPFTFVQLGHVAVAFLWPYVAGLLLTRIILTDGSMRLKIPLVVAMTALVFSSGGYCIAFISLTILPAFIVTMSINGAWTKHRLKLVGTSMVTSAVAVLTQIMILNLTRPTEIPFAPIRGAAEFGDYQGINASLFVPSQFSGIPVVRDFGLYVFNRLFLNLVPQNFCLGDLPSRDSQTYIQCSVLSERLAFPSLSAVLGVLVGVVWLARLAHMRLIDASTSSSNFTSNCPKTSEAGLSTIAMAGVLTFLISSFGLSLFVGYLVPSLRSWGRIQGVILVVGVVVLCVGISSALGRRSTWRPFRTYVPCVVLAIVMIDQGGYSFDSISRHQEEQDRYRGVASALEEKLAPHCGVIVMPSRQMRLSDQTVHSSVYSVSADELFAFYGPTLRWSGGNADGQVKTDSIPMSVWPLADSQPSISQISESVKTALNFGTCAYVFDETSGSLVASIQTMNSVRHALAQRGLVPLTFTDGPLSVLYWGPNIE